MEESGGGSDGGGEDIRSPVPVRDHGAGAGAGAGGERMDPDPLHFKANGEPVLEFLRTLWSFHI